MSLSLAEKARKAADEAVRKKQEETNAQHKETISKWWAEMTTSIEKVSADGGYETRYNMMISKNETLPEQVLAELRCLVKIEKLSLVETPSGEPLVWTISWKKPKVYRGPGPKKGGPENDVPSTACSCGAPSCDRCHGG